MKQLKEAKELFTKMKNEDFENFNDEVKTVKRSAELEDEIRSLYEKKIKQVLKLKEEIKELEKFSDEFDLYLVNDLAEALRGYYLDNPY